jgi:manganese-dependent inorganic pyrophosphatase
MNIYTIGHISPDLDCISAAVEYAEFLNKVKKYGNVPVVPLRAGQPNNETTYVFNKVGATMPALIDDVELFPEDRFILVDHNEESQRHPKVTAAQIIEILDHHKANFTFSVPISIYTQPAGSTSSMVYEHFKATRTPPSDAIAGLMLAGVLDDTQGLKSSTTTDFDKTMATEISTVLKLNIDTETFELFKAKSDVSGLTPMQIVKKDYKIFDFGKKVFIGGAETVEPEKILALKNEIAECLEEIKKEGTAELAFFFVADILKINGKGIALNPIEAEIIERAFATKVVEGVADIGARTSRKKDIAPMIEKAVKS